MRENDIEEARRMHQQQSAEALAVVLADATRWRKLRRALATHDPTFFSKLEEAAPADSDWLTEAEIDLLFDNAMSK